MARTVNHERRSGIFRAFARGEAATEISLHGDQSQHMHPAPALRVIADRIEHGESVPGFAAVFTVHSHS